jgi:4-amino-4-deoxy-L-arabinose transferase-like glycosyltransferase
MQTISVKIVLILTGLTLVVYIAGLPIPVMDIDAAQYASISREMSVNHHFLTVLHRGGNYLDKPPLLFWLSALSYSLFGVSTIAYKLPSLLLTLLGFYATYRLGARLYDRRTGILSAALLASCQAFIYFTNDVRTDANLAASVIFAIWQIVEFSCTKKTRHFFLGFVGITCAMLAKGPIGLMVPLLAFGSYFAGRRDYKMVFKWYWFAGMALVLVLLFPMLWGLNRQFGMEGIKFYSWTQSFGRLTGENACKDSSGYFFFVHTFLWAFLPWMLIAYYGIGMNVLHIVKKFFRRRVLAPAAFPSPSVDIPNSPRFAGLEQGTLSTEGEGKTTGIYNSAPVLRTPLTAKFDHRFGREWLLLGGIVLPFIALSCSHYKLPHYIFVFFPLVAILTAQTILEIVNDPSKKRALKSFITIQFVLCIGAWVFAAVCMIAFFPCKNVIVWLVVIFCAFMTFYFTRKNHSAFIRLVLPSFWAILGVNLMLNVHFFPKLLAYQSGSTAAKIVQKNNIPKDRFFAYYIQNHSADFYMQRIIPCLDSAALADTLRTGNAWIYTEEPGIALMQRMGYSPVIVDTIFHKHVAKVTTRFLFYKTREKTLGKQYIVRIER